MSRKIDIAILGAGVSGLVAARTLAAAGRSVLVIDKGRGPGGRLSTRRGPEGVRLDHGCQFVTVWNDQSALVVRALLDSDVISKWNPTTGDTPVDKPFAEPDWAVGRPTMSSVPKWLAEGMEIECSCRIESLRFDQGQWELSGSEGLVAESQQLLVAIPSPQAIELLEPVGIDFVETMREVVYDPNWTLLVSGGHQQEPPPFDVMTPSSGPLGWIANQGSKPGRVSEQAWIAQATAEWSRDHLEKPADEVRSVLFDALQEQLGGDLQGTPTVHRWRYALVNRAIGRPCLVERKHKLVACGDWCLGPTVGHAMESGVAAAEEILSWNESAS